MYNELVMMFCIITLLKKQIYEKLDFTFKSESCGCNMFLVLCLVAGLGEL